MNNVYIGLQSTHYQGKRLLHVNVDFQYFMLESLLGGANTYFKYSHGVFEQGYLSLIKLSLYTVYPVFFYFFIINGIAFMFFNVFTTPTVQASEVLRVSI